MDRAELLERACHYRALAARISDGQTREGLLDLAERYEALAKEVEKRSDDDPADAAG
jgi:hypothetical protein